MTRHPATPPSTPRLHAGGKLSFRRRVKEVEDDGTLPCFEGGENPPALDELALGKPRQVQIEVGPGKGAFLLAAAIDNAKSTWRTSCGGRARAGPCVLPRPLGFSRASRSGSGPARQLAYNPNVTRR